MADRIEIGKRYHCRELNSPEHRTGIFWCDDEGMRVRLFDYERAFHADDDPLFLQLEDNLIVSMHHNVPGGRGHSSYLHDPPATTYFSGAWANTLIVGRRRWLATDPIRRVWFSVPHSKSLLTHQPRLKMVRAKRFPSDAASQPLFEVEAAGQTVKCWYTFKASWEFGTNDWQPELEVEFAEARTLDTYLDGVHSVLRFLSATAGFQLVPAEISISPLTHAEFAASIDAKKDENFSVEYLWAKAVVEKNDFHLKKSFAMVWDREELAAFQACLRAWLMRVQEWEKASALMMGSLGLVRETSGQRLLMACRWWEAIPGTAAKPVLTNAELNQIAEEASRVAKALGRAGLDKRIRGALRSIRTESNQARLERLLSSVQTAFETEALTAEGINENMIPTLMQTLTYRGQEAHSFVDEESANIRPLHASTAAMEALCYLLTIKDLPMSKKGRQRALFNRVVSAHRYAQLDVGD